MSPFNNLTKDDLMIFVRAILIASLIVCSAAALASEKPSAELCWAARGAVAIAGSEAAAEKAARARGVSEATIAKAKRCPR
jgi:hypothetical protein